MLKEDFYSHGQFEDLSGFLAPESLPSGALNEIRVVGSDGVSYEDISLRALYVSSEVLSSKGDTLGIPASDMSCESNKVNCC